MNPGPTVSVVTPSFQQGRYIGRTIESVRQQSYPVLEHLIQDGGSTDETVDVLQRAGTVDWISRPDHGQTEALNQAVRRSRGEVVAWLNSDDFLFPTALERAVGALVGTSADAVYGRCILVDQSEKAIGHYHTEPFSYPALLRRNIIPQPALIFRRTMYEHFGPFDESLKFAMDYEYWLRCARDAKFVYVPELLAAYRIHIGGKTSRGSREHAAEGNQVRWRYGRGVLSDWELRRIALRTTIGGIAKSIPGGVGVMQALKWRREQLRGARF